MSMQSRIESKLRDRFSPERLAVMNESHLHAGHHHVESGHHEEFDGKGETHFRVRIVAPAFSGMSRIERHRAVNELLADELNHRSKNTLAIIQTIAKQTFRETVAIDAALKLFNSRLRALAIGNDLALKGSTSDAPLREVILSALTPFQPTDRDAFELDGPDVGLPAKRVAPLALAINELATNASKYGALSSATGRVRISWELCAAGSVTLDWRETGGPPVIPPAQRGFGSRLLERGLFRAANDRVRLDYPAGGFTCRIELDPDG